MQLKWAKIAKMFYFFLAIVLVYEVSCHCYFFNLLHLFFFHFPNLYFNISCNNSLCDRLNFSTYRVCFSAFAAVHIYLLHMIYAFCAGHFLRLHSTAVFMLQGHHSGHPYVYCHGHQVNIVIHFRMLLLMILKYFDELESSLDWMCLIFNLCISFANLEIDYLNISALGSFLHWNFKWYSWTFSSATPWSNALPRWMKRS